MSTPPCFFSVTNKGDNFYDFLFASMADKPLPRKCFLLKEKNSHRETNSFLGELTTIEKLRREATRPILLQYSLPDSF